MRILQLGYQKMGGHKNLKLGCVEVRASEDKSPCVTQCCSAFFSEHTLQFSQDLGVSAHYDGTYFLGQGSKLFVSSGVGSGVAGNSFVLHILYR